MSYQIRICKESEYQLLVDFIKKHWNENHIFAKSKEMLDFQHLDRKNKNYNFIVAFNEQSNEFDAILGFIPLNFYDEALSKRQEYWLAIWKVVESKASTGVGLKVLLHFTQEYKPHSLGIIGASQVALRIYKAFKYQTGILQHFYIKNEQMQKYSLAEFHHSNLQATKSDFKITPLKELENIKLQSHFIPYKSLEFFKNKYAKHPIYKYEFYSINEGENCVAFFVARQVFYKEASCLRIVDWWGDFPLNLYDEFQKILQTKRSEYVDLFCFIQDESKITKMDFCKKQDDELVPNYFEPFEKKNVQIAFAYKCLDKNANYAFFKGDSDQDRPNLIKE